MSDQSATSVVPEGGDVDRGTAMLAVFWTQTAFAIVIVACRFYCRSVIKVVGADDWAMLATLVMLITFCGICTGYALNGGGRHLYYLAQNSVQERYILKLNWICQPFAIMSLGLGKISVACLLLRLIGPFVKARRVFLWFLIVLTFIFSIICCILTFAQCNPVAALWDHIPEAVCWDPVIQDNFSLFLGSWNALVDFILALLPISIIWHVNISMRKRIGLCLLLGLGLLAGVCACIKTAHLSALTARSDLTWRTFDLLIWTSTETFLLIFCGSASTLRPLVDILRGRDPTRSDRYGHHSEEAGTPGVQFHSRKPSTAAQNAAGTPRRLNSLHNSNYNNYNRDAVLHRTNAESETTLDEWPLGGEESYHAHKAIEFDVTRERSRPSYPPSRMSSDEGSGKGRFDVV